MDSSNQRESSNATYSTSVKIDNKVELDIDGFNIYEGNFKNIYRKKKFGK